jgi:hypothetical protein
VDACEAHAIEGLARDAVGEGAGRLVVHVDRVSRSDEREREELDADLRISAVSMFTCGYAKALTSVVMPER